MSKADKITIEQLENAYSQLSQEQQNQVDLINLQQMENMFKKSYFTENGELKTYEPGMKSVGTPTLHNNKIVWEKTFWFFSSEESAKKVFDQLS